MEEWTSMGVRECPACHRTGVEVFLRPSSSGAEAAPQETYCCTGCRPDQEPEHEDAGLPEGTERLCRAVEELARELRLLRGMVVELLTAKDGEMDGTG